MSGREGAFVWGRDWIMNTLKQMICVWVADKEAFGAVTDYSSVKGPQPYLTCMLNLACEPSLLISPEEKEKSNLVRKQVQLAVKVLSLTAWCSSSYSNEEILVNIVLFSNVWQMQQTFCSKLCKDLSLFSLTLSYLLGAVCNICHTSWW